MRVLFDHFLAALSIARSSCMGPRRPAHVLPRRRRKNLHGKSAQATFKRGVHSSFGLPDRLGIMRYQSGLSTHQELSIEWDLIPGSEHPLWSGPSRKGRFPRVLFCLTENRMFREIPAEAL